MRTLFNDNWSFAELPLTDCDAMFKDGNPVIYNPDDYFDAAGGLAYKAVRLPHDWQIHHVKDLYKNSVGFYKKTFELDEGQQETKSGIWIDFRLVTGNDEGDTIVWITDADGRLISRKVTLGEYDEMSGLTKIESGLGKNDFIAYPTEDLVEGMKTVEGEVLVEEEEDWSDEEGWDESEWDESEWDESEWDVYTETYHNR